MTQYQKVLDRPAEIGGLCLQYQPGLAVSRNSSQSPSRLWVMKPMDSLRRQLQGAKCTVPEMGGPVSNTRLFLQKLHEHRDDEVEPFLPAAENLDLEQVWVPRKRKPLVIILKPGKNPSG